MGNIPNRAPNLLAASGAIPPVAGLFHITKSTAAALTLAAPDPDGIQMTVLDETGHAHTIVCSASLNGSLSTVTFNGTKGSAVDLISRGGAWWTGPFQGVALS